MCCGTTSSCRSLAPYVALNDTGRPSPSARALKAIYRLIVNCQFDPKNSDVMTRQEKTNHRSERTLGMREMALDL
jgi:hypothetical protein